MGRGCGQSVCVLGEMGPTAHSPGRTSPLSVFMLPSHLFTRLRSPEGWLCASTPKLGVILPFFR